MVGGTVCRNNDTNNYYRALSWYSMKSPVTTNKLSLRFIQPMNILITLFLGRKREIVQERVQTSFKVLFELVDFF